MWLKIILSKHFDSSNHVELGLKVITDLDLALVKYRPTEIKENLIVDLLVEKN